ncbi:hypothetical protein MCC93_17770 [Morococcus cerebrosus]|uniref:Uncharacterized protein n=1 Tax=Morococcus cerebrosus TaxID=1056807 RepID=A0A0C1EDE3_9NEIS|nr:hypothetical protein MCC93_17770 [Morococcus cerebrosus]
MGFAHENRETPYHSPSFLKTLPVGKAHATVLYKPMLLSDELPHKKVV